MQANSQISYMRFLYTKKFWIQSY